MPNVAAARLRSLLFVPADRPERFAKAMASGADALILDLEDSVAPERKAFGRDAVAEWLAGQRDVPAFVRINPLDGSFARDDLAAVLSAGPDGLVLPKAEGAESIRALVAMLDGQELPILPIATETPKAVFALGSFQEVAEHLAGVTWGAEDLPAAIGATTAREEDGRYTPPYELVRSLTLFAAHAAGVPAIETVFTRLDATDALAAYVARGRRDGFTGMMAIHPAQVPVINAGFSSTAADIERARAIVAAFAANPDSGALRLNGQMIDRPHLVQARRLLAQAGDAGQVA